MSTETPALRRGLPRAPGGEPWPPAGVVPAGAVSADAVPSPAVLAAAAASEPAVPLVAGEVVVETPVDSSQKAGAATADAAIATSEAATGAPLRRGLPRVAGGEPWPPATLTPSVAGIARASLGPATGVDPEGASSLPGRQEIGAPHPDNGAIATAPTAHGAPTTAGTVAGTAAATGALAEGGLRRGLPRVAGGEPWPAADVVIRVAAPTPNAAPDGASSQPERPEFPPRAQETGAVAEVAVAEVPRTDAGRADAARVEAAPAAPGPLAPLPFRPTVVPGRFAFTPPAPRAEPVRHGPFTRGQWVGATLVAGAGLLFAAGMVVLAVRWLVSLDALQDFLATYPGEYHLPEAAPVGVPGWIGWQHFFNVFLMVLIIRSGLQVRREKRPGAFWTPRWNRKRKISLSLWFHQSLDILWLANGVIFVVLLFVTGQWMRIVPTSLEVFPNALSAVLQYASLDWPTENGWVNYNSVQQLSYFVTVFLAAPLATITGVRMSGIWPKKTTRLNRLYPIEWARAVHFPVMIYFVAFIIVHVTLVFATGALRNLNHMYAAQGSVDPDAYAGNWAGFWIFVASMVVIVAGWVAARPLVLAPIARMFGSVSSR